MAHSADTDRARRLTVPGVENLIHTMWSKVMKPLNDRVSIDTKYAGDSDTLTKNIKALVHLLAKQAVLDLQNSNDNHCYEGGAS